MSEVVVVGSTNWDIAMYLPSLPLPGETVAGGTLQSGLGGKGANQAVAAFRAGGATTCFISCIGDDDIANSVRQVFSELQMPIPEVRVIDGIGTGSACIFVNAEAENCIGIASGANACVLPAMIDEQAARISSAGAVLVQLEIPFETIERIAVICAENQTPFVLNPAPARDIPEALLPMIDILTPNEVELSQISGMPSGTLEEVTIAAQSLCNQGVGTVVTTLGSRGCLIVAKTSTEFIESFKVAAVDTTAAGDVFNGALVAELVRGEAISDAAKVACAAAAIAVTEKGAIASIPDRDGVLAFMSERL
ncbi:MAG: ribokinase [Pseudomonadales bacterium]|nr:ribokinase [Gammaproteobacteria bacterium]MDG1001581.1 ribokinase [Pseudomonadales bacterium]MDG1302695.1 ribokinase [Pseudomonadales bacterium]MDG1836727.1 ribokinase [Pseudomonadales bacterium]MDG1909666.1 ribokinase [Pseudomonadales bacterium]